MVISGGVNIYPREIEDCLHQHPDVVDCAVLGVPDDSWGEILYAVVQPRSGSSLDADGVVTWCREPRRLQASTAWSSSWTSSTRPERQGAQAQAAGGLDRTTASVKNRIA